MAEANVNKISRKLKADIPGLLGEFPTFACKPPLRQNEYSTAVKEQAKSHKREAEDSAALGEA